MSIPSFIRIYPVDLELNHEDRQTDLVGPICICFLHIVQRMHFLKNVWSRSRFYNMNLMISKNKSEFVSCSVVCFVCWLRGKHKQVLQKFICKP
jgi:hypothetical protein